MNFFCRRSYFCIEMDFQLTILLYFLHFLICVVIFSTQKEYFDYLHQILSLVVFTLLESYH